MTKEISRKPDPQSWVSYPEMGGITKRAADASLSVRLPEELKLKALEKIVSKHISMAEYIRDLLEADLSGKPKRRRRRKYDELRQNLAEIHAAIILCGNQIADQDAEHAQDQIGLLRDAVSSLIALAHKGIR